MKDNTFQASHDARKLGVVSSANTHTALAVETWEGFGMRPEAVAVLVKRMAL